MTSSTPAYTMNGSCPCAFPPELRIQLFTEDSAILCRDQIEWRHATHASIQPKQHLSCVTLIKMATFQGTHCMAHLPVKIGHCHGNQETTKPHWAAVVVEPAAAVAAAGQSALDTAAGQPLGYRHRTTDQPWRGWGWGGGRRRVCFSGKKIAFMYCKLIMICHLQLAMSEMGLSSPTALLATYHLKAIEANKPNMINRHCPGLASRQTLRHCSPLEQLWCG